MEAVRSLLKGEAGEIRFVPLMVAPRHCSQLKRLPYELAIIFQLAKILKRNKTNRILFSSISSANLTALAMACLVRQNIRAIGIAHGILETVQVNPRWGGIRKVLNFRKALLRLRPNNFLLLVNGSFIETKLIAVLPELKGRVAAMPLPYDFEQNNLYQNRHNDTVTFGALGIASYNKGSHLLGSLASKISKANPKVARFLQIGQVVDESITSIENPSLEIISPNDPIPESEYQELANSIDYSLLLHDPEKYQLSCSASLLDSFRFRKPIIAIRNPAIDYYASIMGNIGYVCDNIDEVESIIASICDRFPVEQYQHQVDNLNKGVKSFNLDYLTLQFKAAVDKFWRDK